VLLAEFSIRERRAPTATAVEAGAGNWSIGSKLVQRLLKYGRPRRRSESE
jgi:hypothetical protein